ncbi:MAG: sensor histidine kinase, partial [Ktedonobacterales bacterium]
MREEQLPIENEDRASDGRSGETPESTSWSEVHAPRSTAAFQPKSAGYRALHIIAASLPGVQRVGLLRYEPGNGGQPATFTPVSAIKNEHGLWLQLAPPDLLDPQLLANLAFMAPVHGPPPQPSPVLHLLGTLAILCQNEQGQLQGALVARPDIFSYGTATTLRPSETLLELLTSVALVALELENSALELLRMTRIASDEAQARESFISFAAHELRSPLTSIRGFAQLLARQSRKTSLPEPMMRSVESIDQQSLRMSEMLGEMLDASRILHGALEMMPRPMDLAALIRKVVERRRSLFPERNFLVLGADFPISGYWDSGRVEQIIRD